MKIKAIASTLPEWVIDNETIAQWSGLDRTLLDQKIGVHERRFLRSAEIDACSGKSIGHLSGLRPDPYKIIDRRHPESQLSPAALIIPAAAHSELCFSWINGLNCPTVNKG